MDLYINGASNQSGVPDQQVMTWLYNGYVGIGTTSPASDLEIFDATGSRPGGTTAPTKSVSKLSRSGTTGYSYNENAEFRIGHGGPNAWGSQLDLYINGASNQSGIPDQQAMSWLYNGNVGIGTTTPGGKLEISSQTQSGTSDIMGKYTWAGDLVNWGMRVEQQFNAPLSRIQYNWIMKNGSSADVQVMSFAGGNVLIGETSQMNSSYKLDVAGNVRANQITVNTSGADFVFEPTYHLIPLSSLKTYLDQNHHLPEIASAKEMQEEGLNVGENQMKLLQKVEELTLYLIDKDRQLNDEHEKNTQQDKEVRSQAAQLKSQQEEINQLKQQMELLIKASQKK